MLCSFFLEISVNSVEKCWKPFSTSAQFGDPKHVQNRVEINHDSLDSRVKTTPLGKAVIVPIFRITCHGLNTMIS